MSKLLKFDHKTVERKWRDIWSRKGVYSPNLIKSSKPFYNLMMFPYPSAEGLHVGNMYAFTGADVFGRFNRMKGFDVFEPIGLDGFGIHSENFAIKIGRHPKDHAKISEEHFYNQLSIIGDGYAWDHRLETYDPDYYRWTQWLFLKMFKNGLAYKGRAMVNWCPSCKTVLADEQVIDGKCERCKTEVIKREMSSWFFRITKYADRLLNNIDGIEKDQNTKYGPVSKGYDVKRYGLRWPEKIKTAQRTWIGKKAGINIEYKLDGFKESLTCFTTVPVNWGATFIVIAPEHHLVKKVITGEVGSKETDIEKIKQYVEKALGKSEQQRKLEEKGKTGVFTGLYVINHVTGKKIPVWISDFVLSTVGTGAVQGCPGHDQRDWDFAKKYDIPIIRVVTGPNGEEDDIYKAPQIVHLGDKGKMINSDFLNGVDFTKAMIKTMDYFEEEGWGKRVFEYHLRDWLISRQRYWGPPIPMIFCKKCASEGKSWFTSVESGTFKGQSLQDMAGWFPVPEEDLPVQLPDIKDFKPKGDGSSPLANAPQSWKEVKCPNCGGKAIRELDVSDTFLDSSWYFLAYPNLGTSEWKKGESPFNKEITSKWLPVDAYIGGAEHAVLHLLYSRFITMALHDWGYLAFEEPFPFLFGHGLLIKDGAKMSKSKGNVVNPDDYIERFGADTLRAYLMFLGPYNQGGDFRDTGIEGMKRFIDRVWRLVGSYNNDGFLDEKDKREVQLKMHQTIDKVTKDIQNFGYNTAIAALMEFVNVLQEKSQGPKKTTKVKSNFTGRETIWQEALKNLVLLLAPFTPHIAEETWTKVFNEKFSVHNQPWPKYDLKYLKVDKMTIVVQIDGKVRSQLTVSSILSTKKDEIEKMAQKDNVTAKWLKGKKITKTVFVPGRLINFVTK